MNGSKRLLFSLLACAVFVAAASAAWGEEAQSEGPQFVQALLSRLGDEGWGVQERNEIAAAVGQLDLSAARGADPEAVALALTLEEREMAGHTGSQQLPATEQAQLAFQLALMTAEMSSAGFDSHDVAVAAMNAVRNSLGDIQAWLSGGRKGELGQVIRARVAAAVRLQVQANAAARPAGRGPDAGQGSESVGASGQGMQGAGVPVNPPRGGR